MNPAAFNKFKQQICENSAELREFERRLQTAYNRQMLEVQLANKKLQLGRKNIEEKELAQIERERHTREELRVIEEEKCRREEERRAASILQKQMIIRKQKQLEELHRDSIDRAALEEQLRIERQKELTQERALQEEKIMRLREQQAVLELHNKQAEEERERQAHEEKKIQEEANRLFNYDEAIIVERQRRIQAFEALKEALLKQLVEQDRVRKEKEEISIRLHCLEREEAEEKKSQEEHRAMILKKEQSRCTYEEVTRDRILQMRRAKDDDRFYAENMRAILMCEEEREKLVERESRRVRTAVRAENDKLMRFRQHERAAMLREEMARAEADMAERERQAQLVAEERLRLLRLMGEDMRRFLPPGTVTEEDLLRLNADKLNNTSQKAQD